MNLPKRIIWHDTKERPKTAYLLRGFRELGIKIEVTNRLVSRYKPRSNNLGLYVYPFQVDFGSKNATIFYDIGTNPDHVYTNFLQKPGFYFKNHISKNLKKRYPQVLPAANSVSNPDVYLHELPRLRMLKDKRMYINDFLFIGWHDDRGLRMATVKLAKAQRDWKVLAGLMPFKHHSKVPDDLLMERLLYREHLAQQCQAKVNLALPGGFAEPFMSFRHVELLGMGCCIITKPCDAVLTGNPKGIWIEYTLGNFVDKVNYYLCNADERERIAAAGRDYFDRNLTPKANALHIINTVSNRLQ